MRRKQGVLLPIERSILEMAVQLRRQGVEEFHGFQIAKEIKEQNGARFLASYGTLYRALSRLEHQGFLNSHWEDPLPEEQNRPRRRYYRLTGQGTTVLLNPIPENAPKRFWACGVSRS